MPGGGFIAGGAAGFGAGATGALATGGAARSGALGILGIAMVGAAVSGPGRFGAGTAGPGAGGRGNGPDIDSTGTLPFAAAEPGMIGIDRVVCDGAGRGMIGLDLRAGGGGPIAAARIADGIGVGRVGGTTGAFSCS